MKVLFFLLSQLLITTLIFAQDKPIYGPDYVYELNKEYVFASGDIEMKVFLDAKGNATISRNKIEKLVSNRSFVFFEKGAEVQTLPTENTIALKNEKLGEKYWIIPFEPKSEVIHMRNSISVKVDCHCQFEVNGVCDLRYGYAGSVLQAECYSPDGCGKCVATFTVIESNKSNFLMIKAESVQIAEK